MNGQRKYDTWVGWGGEIIVRTEDLHLFGLSAYSFSAHAPHALITAYCHPPSLPPSLPPSESNSDFWQAEEKWELDFIWLQLNDGEGQGRDRMHTYMCSLSSDPS